MKHFSKSIGQCLMTVLMTSTIIEIYTLPLLDAFDSAASAAPAGTDRTTSKTTAVIVPTSTLPETAAPENAPNSPVSVAVETIPVAPEPTAEIPVSTAADVPQPAEASSPTAPEAIASPDPTSAETPASSPAPSPAKTATVPAASPDAAPNAARLAATRQSIANKLAALVNRDRPALASQLQNNLVALAIYYAQIGEFKDARQVAHHPSLPIEVQTAVLAEIDQIVALLGEQPGGQPIGTAQLGAQAGQGATDSKTPTDPSKTAAGATGTAAIPTEPLTIATAVNSQALADPGYQTVPAAPELLQPYLSDRCLNPNVIQAAAVPAVPAISAATGSKPIAVAQPTRSSPFLPIGQHVAAQLKTVSVAANSPTGQLAQPKPEAIAPAVQVSQTVLVSRTAPIRSTAEPAAKPSAPIAQLETSQNSASLAESPLSKSIAPAALNPLGVTLPKTIDSTVSSWFYGAASYGAASLPIATLAPLSTLAPISALIDSTKATPPIDNSLLPEDSYTPTQVRINMSALPKFIKLTREATKSTLFPVASPAVSAVPVAKSIAANPTASQTADYWRTIATNCGGLQSSDVQGYAMSPAANRKLAGSGMVFPLPMLVPITSGFGWRIHPISGDRRFHTGLDLGAPYGTPVLSAMAGRVVQAGEMGGYGLAVVVQATSGQQENLYGHLSAIAVKPGDQVAQGGILGLVGSTGNSTGPHLHFETLLPTTEGWTAVDPLAAAALASASVPQ